MKYSTALRQLIVFNRTSDIQTNNNLLCLRLNRRTKKNLKIQGLKIKALKYCSDWASWAMKIPFWCTGIIKMVKRVSSGSFTGQHSMSPAVDGWDGRRDALLAWEGEVAARKHELLRNAKNQPRTWAWCLLPREELVSVGCISGHLKMNPKKGTGQADLSTVVCPAHTAEISHPW